MVNNESREINTGGGAFAEGGVETGGGDFVGRDQYKQSISAQGYGSIQNVTQISGEVVYNLYSGADVFKKHIRTREFQTLVAERTKTFIGRDFIFSAINALLDDPEFPSGYIVIIGEPGIGKTSLLAQLVQTTGLVHHFNIASQFPRQCVLAVDRALRAGSSPLTGGSQQRQRLFIAAVGRSC